ncbi:DUF1796 family putative cysteine peptidase [Paenibacillus filicis]|uniref:DUF1796 family putative cysteine peptidase n=1 Tax=Paenibacillus filicis TaxID=669464 RepID=A0ABU9DIU1_9BACL
MRWNDCVGPYKSYISLGANCQVAYQLSRLGLRQASGPLDWFTSESVPGLVRLLQHRFKGLMTFRNMRVVDRIGENFVVEDPVYDIISYHDFPVYQQNWWDAYPAFKQKLERRVNRFWQTLQHKPILFIRTETTIEEAQQIKAALNTLMHGGFRLLIVNSHTYPNSEIVDEEWALKDVCCVTVPRGHDWRGSDGAWNRVMSGFTVQKSQAMSAWHNAP